MLAVGHLGMRAVDLRVVSSREVQVGDHQAVSQLGMRAVDLRAVSSREMQAGDHQAAVHPEFSKAAGIIARQAGLRRVAEAGLREAETAEA